MSNYQIEAEEFSLFAIAAELPGFCEFNWLIEHSAQETDPYSFMEATQSLLDSARGLGIGSPMEDLTVMLRRTELTDYGKKAFFDGVIDSMPAWYAPFTNRSPYWKPVDCEEETCIAMPWRYCEAEEYIDSCSPAYQLGVRWAKLPETQRRLAELKARLNITE